MLYQQLLEELNSLADENYRNFHRKLLKNDSLNLIGARIPDLRKIAKRLKGHEAEVMTFPDDYYEVTFIKLTVISYLKYDEFIKYIDKCVRLINNWATCDCFAPKCVVGNEDTFLPYIFKYAAIDAEFYQRFALTSLLHFYIKEKYLETIFRLVEEAKTDYYYVYMGAAWLIAEVLVKFYDIGVEFLKKGTLDKKTHNKSIQKATESYRLSVEQKYKLKGMKK